jgi:protein-disulfide isomerase
MRRMTETPSRLPSAKQLRYIKRANLFLALIPLAFILGLLSGFLLWGTKNTYTPDSAAAVAQPTSTTVGTRIEVSVDDDPFLGPADAPITIVEFSDYECPFCTKWHVEVWPRLQEAYPDQVRLVYRDFPLYSIHGNAIPAAEAANCAGEQNKYWEYHELLFQAKQGLGEEAFKQYATEIGLDEAAFNECLESRRYQDEVDADLQAAMKLGVRSTPTFYINGIPLIGAQPYQNFKDLIDKELAGEIPK